MVASSSTLSSAAGSSHLECGDRWDLHLGLDVHPPVSAVGVHDGLGRDLGRAAAGSSFVSGRNLRVNSLHFEQDVGGVVVLVGVGVVLGRREGAQILLAGEAWPLLAPLWTCEASGKVAHLHLVRDSGHLLRHELVNAYALAGCVLGRLEDGRGNFAASS